MILEEHKVIKGVHNTAIQNYLEYKNNIINPNTQNRSTPYSFPEHKHQERTITQKLLNGSEI